MLAALLKPANPTVIPTFKMRAIDITSPLMSRDCAGVYTAGNMILVVWQVVGSLQMYPNKSSWEYIALISSHIISKI
jgi:hypothetical protein